MRSPAVVASTLWALLVALALAIALRATYRTDLSAFLPRSPSAAQQLLIEQLRDGPAGRLIVAAIAGADADTRAALSVAMARELRASGLFTTVGNGDAASLERDREFLFSQRYLLSESVTPQRFTVQGLHDAIAVSLDTLASPEGLLVKPLFTRDPTGELLSILESMSPGAPPRLEGGVWSSRDGTQALLLLQTSAAGSDTDAQQAAGVALRDTFARERARLPAQRAREISLRLSGSPVFAVAARTLIRGEVLRLSCLSAALIATLLLAVYRSALALALGFLPVVCGALAGVAAVALGFGTVHAITLGFGVTLIGEAVDYSIYLFVQGGAQPLWPTLRLGVLTSITGFAALLPSSFQGLAQLGLYSIAGLIAAALVTRYVLPHWLPPRLRIRDLRQYGARLLDLRARLRVLRPFLLLLAAAAAAVLWLHRSTLLSADLAALSPISVADQDLDRELRADLGAPDVRYMLVLTGANPEAALQAAARLGGRLKALMDAGVIGGFESPARYLPPTAVQNERRASLPESGVLVQSLQRALADLPVRAQTLQPFVEDVQRARRAPLLIRRALDGTSFAALVDALLIRTSGGVAALFPVAARDSGDLTPEALAQLQHALADMPGATLLDLKGETDRLYGGYLKQAVQLSLAGFAAIVLLLVLSLRSVNRVLRVLAPLALAVMVVGAVLSLSGQRLGILHVVGMLLIVAIASNYALFFDRERTQPDADSRARTFASILVANLATVLGFGVLAFSRVPVLSDLGTTVAPGALLALLFAALLSEDGIGASHAQRRADAHVA